VPGGPLEAAFVAVTSVQSLLASEPAECGFVRECLDFRDFLAFF
jgi:hypothetical protein